jgi:hypothetical protein
MCVFTIYQVTSTPYSRVLYCSYQAKFCILAYCVLHYSPVLSL